MDRKNFPQLGIGMTAPVAMMALLALTAASAWADDPWMVVEGTDGPGKGRHIVLVSGDEEYRSEEALPQLAKILARHHGFKCTVLFAIDPADGSINPNKRDNIPGLHTLASADLVVLFVRFRDLPDDQMALLIDAVEAGKPVVALRTSTHAFDIKPGRAFAQWSWRSKDPDGGFGRCVLGETWVSHHGVHGQQSTRGLLAAPAKDHPILRGLADGDVWGPSDVYTVRLPLPEGCVPLLMGQVLTGMNPSDPPLAGAKNAPMMPVAWVKTYTGSAGKPARVFTTTMGCSQDLESEGFRRLLVNACYWAAGLEQSIPAKSTVDLVGEYRATPFKFGGFVKGLKPADYAK